MQDSDNPVRLKAESVSAQRGGKILFSGLSFCLQARQILVLSGANGTGKSTLLRIMAGLYAPFTGAVKLQLQDGAALPRPLFSHYLSDKNAMKPQLSVQENMRFWLRFSADRKHDRTEERETLRRALSKAKMETYADLPFAALSTGQKRRVALSRLIASPRPLWLLDEPTSGLDQAADALFTQICREHLNTGGLIIAATHLPLGLKADKTISLADYRPKTRKEQFYDPFNAPLSETSDKRERI